MPIEIRELVVRTTVVPPNQQPPQSSANATNDPLSMEVKEALIQECINQILAILEKQKDR
jgi:hypothetical protein